MADKIIQIIKAPDNLYAQIRPCYGTGIMKESTDEEGIPFYEEEVEWASDDDGYPCFDDYKVICLALVEKDNGDRDIVPMIVDDDIYERKINNIDLATNWRGYNGCEIIADDKKREIKFQNGMGILSLQKGSSYYVSEDADGYFGIYFIIDSEQIEVARYKQKREARIVYEQISDSSFNFKLPTEYEAQELVREEIFHEEFDKALELFEKNFSFSAAHKLANAGYRTLDELKKATDDELKERKINKTIREAIKKKLNLED